MFELPRRKRKEIERELKAFAFEQSPLFKDDAVQGVEVTQNYEVIDDWSDHSLDDGESEQPTTIAHEDLTVFEIGFESKRIKSEDEKPDYTFAARFLLRRFIHPNELVLSREDWQDLGEYCSLDEGEDDEDDETEKSPSQIIEMLREEMSVCEQYRRVDYSYDTREATIRVNDEKGYLIDGTSFNAIESHPYVPSYENETEDKDSEEILNAPDSGDQLLDALQFEHATSTLREEYEENGDIMPHEDKLEELRFLLRCLKNRTLPMK